MTTVLAWTLRAVGVVAALAAAVRLTEWRIERWVVSRTRMIP